MSANLEKDSIELRLLMSVNLLCDRVESIESESVFNSDDALLLNPSVSELLFGIPKEGAFS